VFLEAAERGDRHTVERCLTPPRTLNVNCTDLMGRTALQIAVDNENAELVELLLQQPDIRIGIISE
jgi:transient receptor potential cation channel subfamily C protein 4